MTNKQERRRDGWPISMYLVGLALCSTLVSGSWSARAAVDSVKPNIIVIMVDDMGYGDAGCYGNTTIATPNIDSLAAGGLRFADFYAAGAWCMPSRMGLMTGVHPYRGGFSLRGFGEKITMAEILKRRGYATALIGKWHLGMREGLHPLEQGFDYYYGTPGSNDVPAPEGKS